MPTDGPSLPDPKARTLARGPRRYRRKVASCKEWEIIAAEKLGPCRICGAQGSNGTLHGRIQLHHVVSRAQGGDDVADNIVPLCLVCHGHVTNHEPKAISALYLTLTEAETAYMLHPKGGRR